MGDDAATATRTEAAAAGGLREVALFQFARAVGTAGGALLDGRLMVLLPTPAASVRADPERLADALLYLLSNAAVHGAADGTVELRFLRERDAWRFEVADEADNLPPDEHEIVTVVRGLAEAQGGSAGVEARPGGGTTYWLRLPKEL